MNVWCDVIWLIETRECIGDMEQQWNKQLMIVVWCICIFHWHSQSLEKPTILSKPEHFTAARNVGEGKLKCEDLGDKNRKKGEQFTENVPILMLKLHIFVSDAHEFPIIKSPIIPRENKSMTSTRTHRERDEWCKLWSNEQMT